MTILIPEIVRMNAYFIQLLFKSCLSVVSCITAIVLFTSSIYAESGKDFLSKEEREWLAINHSHITRAVETGYAPFTFIDSKDRPAGLAHDYMLLLESKLGVQFKEKHFSTLNEILDKLKSGDVRIVNAVTNTPARSEYIKFTVPFITVPNVIITQNNRTGSFKEETLNGLRVSLVKGYAVTEYLTNKSLNFSPDLVPDDITALYNVSSGHTDAAIIDLASASYLISTKGITNLRIAGETTFAIRLAMGTTIAEPMLNSIIQKGLAQITKAEHKEIRNRWINISSGNIIADWRFWAVLISALFALCAAIFGNILWNRTLRRQVALRTEELTRETGALQILKEKLQAQNEELATSEEELLSQNEQLIAIEEMLRVQICEHETSQKLLHDSEERYRLIMESVAVIPWEFNIPENRWTYVSSRITDLLGYAPEEWTTLEWWQELIHPEDHWVPEYCADLTSRGEEHSMEYRLRAKDGSFVWVNDLVAIIMLDGKPNIMRGVLVDITERKQAEKERIKLEQQLHQMQKIESVGRLAGGVAHDFNNMLGVILGHTHLALMETDPTQPLHANLEEIRLAAERSADLTRQLLAFARKQTIAPKMLDLNDTVVGMLKMLQRLIGEDINLAWQPSTGLWQVKMDPSQIDQILANLCVNARDSLSDNGKIVIETANRTIDEHYALENPDAAPGEYVALTVSDNGCGMNKETMTQIFEPFFTTKGVGEGTGLGLATVYGAVKQNGGFISVYSEPDMGTKFIIHIPRYAGQSGQADDGQDEKPLPRGNETILLVEDEPAILKMVSIVLTKQGYNVMKMQFPGEALQLTKESTNKIHILITDVVMPEMNGRDLSKQLQAIHPNLKTLFMSGYTADVIAHHGVLDDGVHFIQKPFSLQNMAVKVREVLDSN